MKTFCEAKSQKSDLQTVERTKCAVLERLVMGKAICALLGQSKKSFSRFLKAQENLERVKPEAEKRFYKTSRIAVLKCESVSTEGTKI